MKTFFEKTPALFHHRETYELHFGETWNDNRNSIIGGILLYIAIMLARSWDNFSNPGLYAEDSVHYFNFYYGNSRSFADILQHPNGYYNIYNNLIAWLVAKADILYQPLLYQCASILLSVLTIITFTCSGLIKSRHMLLASPLLLGLSGMNHLYYYISLTFQMYVVILLLLVMLFWGEKLSPFFTVSYFLLASFLIWSGPYSVLLVPFSFCFIVLFKGRTALLTGLLIITLAYTVSVTKSTIMLENLFSPFILELWGKTLVTEVYFMGFKNSVNPEKLLLIAFTLASLLIYLRKERFYLKVSLLFAVLIVSSLAPLFLSQKYLLYQRIFPCHLLIAQFFWLAFILYSLDKILLRLRRFRDGAGIVLVMAIAAFIVIDNVTHSDKYKVPILPAFNKFIQTVKKAEQMDLEQQGKRMIISTNGTGPFKAVADIGDKSAGKSASKRVHIQ